MTSATNPGIVFKIGGTRCAPNDRSCISRQMKKMVAAQKSRRNKLADMNIPMKKASIFLDTWVQRNFKTEGGNVGGWEPFSRGGRVSNKGLDVKAKLLQDTGRLRLSFLPFASRNNAGIGSDIPYAIKHEKGIGVPKRRMLPLKSEVMEPIKNILSSHVKSSLK